MSVLLRIRLQAGLWLALTGSLATSEGLAQTPTVTTRTPAANAVTAPRSGPITTSFSAPISAATAGSVRVFGSVSQGNSGAVVTGGGTATLRAQPGRAWTPGEVVSVTVPVTVLGTNGTAARPEVYQFVAGAGAGPADFAGGPTLPLTTAPNSVLVGDIDLDGDIDLVSPAGGTVGIRLNDGTGTFSPAPDLTPVNGNANLTFQAAALADIDNDGRLDLITSGIGPLDVWRNTGGGSFAYLSRLSTVNVNGVPLAADIDADGDLDILVPNPGYRVVQVWLNAGNGTFNSAPAVPVDEGVYRLAVADLDADGDLDMLGAGFANGNYANSYVDVRLNNGNGTFSNAPTLAANALASNLALGDLDGDGDVDLVVGCSIGDTNLLLGNGNGTFTAAADVPSASRTGGVTLADVDGDGDLDLVRTYGGSNAAGISLNDGAAHFGPTRLVRLGNGPGDLALADLDGDLALDMVSADANGSGLTLRFNRLVAPSISGFTPGSGSVGSSVDISGSGFSATTMVLFNGLGASFVVNSSGSLTATVPPGATSGPLTVATASGTAVSAGSFAVTGPPAPTVLSRSPARNTQTSSGSGAVSLTFSQPVAAATAAGLRVWGSRSGGRRLETVSGGGTATLSLQPAAFRPGEVVQVSVPASVQGSNGTPARPETYQFTTAAGTGSGQFLRGGDISALVSPSYMQPADMDADGDLDLIVGVPTGIQVFVNDGQARFSPGRMLISFTRSAVGSGAELDLADLDNDGDLEMFAAGGGYYRNDGSTFTSQTIPSLLGGGQMKAGDLDGDGDLDLVSSNSETGEGLVAFNDGTGSFGPASRIDLGLGAQNVALADVDGDGDLDLLSPNYLVNTVTLSRNNGRGSFAPAEVLTTATNLADLKLADMDADGDLDLVALSSYEVQGNTVVVLRNDGQGHFTVATRVQAYSNMYRLYLADLDGDNHPDLVLTGSNKIDTYHNTGAGGLRSAAHIDLGPSYAFNMSVEDYNGDGALDLLYLVNGGAANNPALQLNMLPPPIITSFTPRYGLAGTVVTLTGQGFTSVQSVDLNGLAVSNLVVVSPTSITFTVPVGATSGYIHVNTSHGSADSPGVFDVSNTPPDLIVDQFMNVSGNYRNVTVLSYYGTVANLVGPLTVTGTLTVRGGGTLATNCQPITGPGSFVMEQGATLTICDPAGISLSGPTGAVQLTGTRTFADGYYTYNGTQAQVTGSGLPGSTATVTVNNPAGLTLSQPLALKERLLLTRGNLATAGQGLTLVSTLVLQAYVDNTGGVVQGTVAVQRRVMPYRNAGLGYRHFSAPISNATVSSLTTAGFVPVVNPAYNTAPNPGQVQPFPTVLGYDASRSSTVISSYSTFDKGWVSPGSLTDPLVPGRGYTVNLDGLQTVSFNGPLNNGPVTLPLTRPATPAAEGGWQLLGNPYPSPLDWSLVSLPAGVEPALYIFQSSSPYGGSYRRYVNGIGNPVLDMGQGFFVRLADSVTAAALTLTNAARRLDLGPNLFARTTDLRPQLPLHLTDAAGRTDSVIVYFEAGATTGFDAGFDARQLTLNTGGEPSVWAVASGGQALSICGLPPVAAATVRVPLGVALPQSGSFSLAIPAPLNSSGLRVWLDDAVTGSSSRLDGGAAYRFSAAAGTLTGRFALRIGPAATLTTPAATLAAGVSLFPNPAHEQLTVRVPGVAGAATFQVELLNALGQVVGQAAGRLTSTGGQLLLPLSGNAAGLYLVRVRAGAAVVTRQVVVR